MLHHPIGSVWRKWDLHFHTPSSYDYKDKSITNEALVNALVDGGIRVVAITDHNVIDVARISELRRFAKGRVTILPGIELCSELGGHNSVHYIGIFSENNDVENLWHNLSVELKLTQQHIAERGGHQRVYTRLEDAAEIIHEHGGLLSVHAGTKSNTMEAVSSKYLFKQALKSDLLKKHVIDLLEIGRVEDLTLYRETVFPNIDDSCPVVICSDNHRATEYQLSADCWIKADPSFYGLLQTLVEPEDRIYIGEKPDKRKKVVANRTKYIRSVQICKKDNSDLGEFWFDGTDLELNHDLVAIIGNKGTGKSALAEVIGLLGNSKNESNFDFLSQQRFRAPKPNRSEHFEATVNWESDATDKRSLDASVDPNDRERVKFIPQGLFEEICNEIAGGEETKFNQELEKVIFSHVGAADRLGKNSLKELLDYLTDETYDAIEILKSQLHDVNGSISEFEHKLDPEYLQTITNLLEGKRDELTAHEQSVPEAVPRPDASPETASPKVASELQKEKRRLEQLTAELQAAINQENESALKMSAAVRGLQQIENFREKFRLFEDELSEELNKIDVAIDKIVELKLNLEPIQEKRKIFESTRLDAKSVQDETVPGSLPQRMRQTEEKITALQDKLDEPSRLYEAYRAQLSQWRREKERIVGSPEKNDSIAYYEARLEELAELPKRLEVEKKRRHELTKEIYDQIKQLVKTFEDLYQPVQTFSNKYGLSDESFQLNFDVSIVDTELEDKFFNWIAKNRVGSFYGNGEEVLKKLLEQFHFDDWEDVKGFLEELMTYLKYDLRQSTQPRVKINEQLKKGQDALSLYDYIFSLNYLRPRYVLKLDEKEIGRLSPGERGALLLVFYLLIDRDDIPLIIDQPEENLDNQTVYQRLVSAIKVAKARRQIIVVTHNPNLAVVCDAEQVVCCDIDKKNGNRIEYISGAIENPEINAKIVDILEGTKPAFNNRRSKYAPFDNLLDS